jgi:hypothetical protein
MSDPHIEPADELADLIEGLHDSEINGEISWFYDGVWGAKLGDRWNGFVAEATFVSLQAATRWLREKAIELYPDSEFAKQHRRGFE